MCLFCSVVWCWSLPTKTSTKQGSGCCPRLHSDYIDPFETSLSGNVITLLLKRTKVSSLSAQIFPCPLQTAIHTEFVFLFFCADVWRPWKPVSYYIFTAPHLHPSPPPLTQLVLSLFIEHIHISQTYFKSKLSQTLEAPYPNMAFRRVYFVHQFA